MADERNRPQEPLSHPDLLVLYAQQLCSKQEPEPVLTIKASDPLAASIAMEYAREVEDAGYPKQVVDDLFTLAYKIREWQAANPDKIKRIDDVNA